MGVVHSMEEEQVQRVSVALRESAEAIQGINQKFDVVDEHWHKMNAHHQQVTARIDETLASFQRMEETFSNRVDTVMNVVNYATDELSAGLENMLIMLSSFDIRREATQMPKIIIPLAIPLIVLLIELAVANAYLGILLASLPEIRQNYSRYLLSNASSVLIGLSVSLLWLGGYRLRLSSQSRRLRKQADTHFKEWRKKYDHDSHHMDHTDHAPESTLVPIAGDKSSCDISEVSQKTLEEELLRRQRSSHSSRVQSDSLPSELLDSCERSDEITEGRSVFTVPQFRTRAKPPQSLVQASAANRIDSQRQETPIAAERRRSAASIHQRGHWNGPDMTAEVSSMKSSPDLVGQADRRQKPEGPRFSNVVQKLIESREQRGTSNRERLNNRLAAMGREDIDDQVAPIRQRRSTCSSNESLSSLGSSGGVVRPFRSFARGSSVTFLEPDTGLQDAVPRAHASLGRSAARSSQGVKDQSGTTATNVPAAEAEGKMKPQFPKFGDWISNPWDTKVHWSTGKRATPDQSEPSKSDQTGSKGSSASASFTRSASEGSPQDFSAVKSGDVSASIIECADDDDHATQVREG